MGRARGSRAKDQLRNSRGEGERTFPSVRLLMTIPNADKLLLIFLASSNVCPLAPVFPTYSRQPTLLQLASGPGRLTFSDPARSTRYKFPLFCDPVSTLRWWIPTTKIE